MGFVVQDGFSVELTLLVAENIGCVAIEALYCQAVEKIVDMPITYSEIQYNN